MNAANYPKTYKVYEALGDLYLAKGNKGIAIKSFEKALAMKEIPDLRMKLNNLNKK